MNVKLNIAEMQKKLEEKAKQYLQIIINKYAIFFDKEDMIRLKELIQNNIIIVEKDTARYENLKAEEILNNPNLNDLEKANAINNIEKTLAHGGRVFNDNRIHFYPSTLKNATQVEATSICEELLIHELLHFFIRPKRTNFNSKTTSDLTEALVDMIARDIHQKYNLFPNYNSNYAKNVVTIREALDKIPEDERLSTIFSGNYEVIYQHLIDYQTNSNEDKIKLELFIKDMAITILNDKERERIIYNFIANYKNIEEAMSEIKKYVEINMPEKASELDRLFKEHNLKQARTLEDESLKRVLKKPDNFGFLNTSIIIAGTLLVILITTFITFLAIKK